MSLKYYDINTLKNLGSIEWIVDKIFPSKSISLIYGQPGCFKTFIALDISLNLSQQLKNWHGYDINSNGIIIYLIGEGIHGLYKRIDAWFEYNDVYPKNNIKFIPINCLNIWLDKDFEKLNKTIDHILENENKTIDMIVVDTLARAITGLEENSAKDMSIFLQKMEIIKEKYLCSIMFLHHCGKEIERGSRGSSSILGAIDTSICITKKGLNLTMDIQKQKDGEEFSIDLSVIKIKESLVICDKKDIILQTNKTTNIILNTQRDNSGMAWTDSMNNQLIGYIKDGLNLKDISDNMGRTKTSIKYQVKKILNEKGYDDMKKSNEKIIKIFYSRYPLKCDKKKVSAAEPITDFL